VTESDFGEVFFHYRSRSASCRCFSKPCQYNPVYRVPYVGLIRLIPFLCRLTSVIVYEPTLLALLLTKSTDKIKFVFRPYVPMSSL